MKTLPRAVGWLLAGILAVGATAPVHPKEPTDTALVYPILVDDKWGFILENGDVIASPKYDTWKGLWLGMPGCSGLWYDSNIADVHGPVAVGYWDSGLNTKWGFVSTEGEIVAPQYDDVYGFRESVAAVSRRGKWGFIDMTGEEVIPFQFDYATSFRQGVSVVMIDGWWGLVDHKAQYIVEPKYDVIRYMTHGPHFMFETQGKQGVISANGQVLVDAKFDKVHVFSEGLVTVQVGGKAGYYNIEDQRFEIEPQFDVAAPFVEDVAYVKKNGLVGFIDRNGDFTFAPKQSNEYSYSDFLGYEYNYPTLNPVYRYQINSGKSLKWGLINVRDGSAVIEPELDSIEPVFEGRARFWERGKFGFLGGGGKYGFLDAEGNLAIPAQYKLASDFSEGLAWVRSSDRSGYIDTQGQFVIELEDYRLRGGPFRPKLALIHGDGRDRYINRAGEEIYSFDSGCD